MKQPIAKGKFSKTKHKPGVGASLPKGEKRGRFSKERPEPKEGLPYSRGEGKFPTTKRPPKAWESRPEREGRGEFPKTKRPPKAWGSRPEGEGRGEFPKTKRPPKAWGPRAEGEGRGEFPKTKRPPKVWASRPEGEGRGEFSKTKRPPKAWGPRAEGERRGGPPWKGERREGGEERGRRRSAQWVWGMNPVKALLKHAPQKIVRLYLAKGQEEGRLEFLQEKAEAGQVALEWVEREALDLWTGEAAHQGVLAEVEAFSFLTEEALMELVLPAQEGRLLLLLDGVEDPQNLGAIARTALGMGVSALVIGKNRAAGITAAAMKASAGALVHLPVAQVTNLTRLLERLKEGGYWSLAASPQASTVLWEIDAKGGPWVVVIGGEGKGIGANLLKHCDFQVQIPMVGQISSLNASVSSGMVLYELVRRSKQGVEVEVEGPV